MTIIVNVTCLPVGGNSIRSAKTEKMKESRRNEMLNIIHKYVEGCRRKL
jgi:hypothetical protein